MVHDIFPFGPERENSIKAEDKNPFPENIKLKVLEENAEVYLQGKKYKTTLFMKE